MDYSIDSDVMLITFGAMGFKRGTPPFGLLESTSEMAAKKLYIRDLKRAWYHQGLPEIGNSIEDISMFLRRIIRQEKVHRVVVMGGSMGGYAALLFGWLVEADVVHSFNPVTIIDPLKRFFYGDYFRLGWKLMKWKLFIISVIKSSKLSKEFIDLVDLFSSRDVKTEFHIHFSSKGRSDRFHALRMNIFPNVTLHEYNDKSHSLRKIMLEGDYLQKIISGSLNSDSVPLQR